MAAAHHQYSPRLQELLPHWGRLPRERGLCQDEPCSSGSQQAFSCLVAALVLHLQHFPWAGVIQTGRPQLPLSLFDWPHVRT